MRLPEELWRINQAHPSFEHFYYSPVIVLLRGKLFHKIVFTQACSEPAYLHFIKLQHWGTLKQNSESPPTHPRRWSVAECVYTRASQFCPWHQKNWISFQKGTCWTLTVNNIVEMCAEWHTQRQNWPRIAPTTRWNGKERKTLTRLLSRSALPYKESKCQYRNRGQFYTGIQLLTKRMLWTDMTQKWTNCLTHF